MINGQKPQRKRGDAPSVSCIQGQQCYPVWNSMKQASVFGKGGLLDELWMLLLRCQANCDVADD